MTVSIHDLAAEVYTLSHMFRCDPGEADLLQCEEFSMMNVIVGAEEAEFHVSISLKNEMFRLATLVVVRTDDPFNTDTQTYVIDDRKGISHYWGLLEERFDKDG